MRITYQLTQDEGEQEFVPFNTNGELASEMLIRTAHALRYMSDGIWDEDSHVVEDITRSKLVILSPEEGKRVAGGLVGFEATGATDVHFVMESGTQDGIVEYVWLTDVHNEFGVWVR